MQAKPTTRVSAPLPVWAAAMAFAAFAALTLLQLPALAADEVELSIAIKDHKFDPAELKVPAGKAIKLTVRNLDSTAEEFESRPLKVERVIAGNSTAVIRIKALSKGSYKFFGEFHEKTAQGVLVAE
jgi:plastocyanin